MTFPKEFLWGVATSAYQVEGSPLADGAGPSIWHRFVRTPGRIVDGGTGDVACDHYHRYEDDVRLMQALGVKAYRFSVAWSRILPEGTGRVNPAGLAFYDRLVDTLLAHGITPFVTLYHWDLPAALDDQGGWLNPDVAGWFADYAATLFRALDDRVPYWATLNEPWVVMDGGYLNGGLAPGHRNLFEAPRVAHNLLRAHARAVEVYRAFGRHAVGLVLNLEPKYPATDSEEDRAATARADAYMNRIFVEPVLTGRYPDLLPEIFGEAWPEIPEADVERIAAPIDFLGVNYYTRGVTAFDPDAPPLQAKTVPQPTSTYTEMGWEVYPDGLYDTLAWLHGSFDVPPLFITENGAAFYDPPRCAGGRIEDPLRVDYFRTHLRALCRALTDGIDIRGYFAWSLLDNFEWSYGYTKRFGIVHVDYQTQARTPKASARFLARVFATNGACLAREAAEAGRDG
ncbi:MAG: beta-glucosidase [Rhodothermaceae bacterium]|nr:MAG: beta-glucosidase [Rhodothermaceae bacterium]